MWNFGIRREFVKVWGSSHVKPRDHLNRRHLNILIPLAFDMGILVVSFVRSVCVHEQGDTDTLRLESLASLLARHIGSFYDVPASEPLSARFLPRPRSPPAHRAAGLVYQRRSECAA